MLYNEYIHNRKQYQEVGRDLLLSKKHACLFFEPGKGKTYPVIDALYEIDKDKGGKTNVLIISSCDAIRKMWQPEIVPQKILPKNTYLVTDRTAVGEMSILLTSRHWDVIIVDECHIVKANSSKIHKLIYKLCRNVEYAWGLTGTPRGNSDIDIWCQLQALHVGGQGKLSYSAWTRTFCDFEEGYGKYGRFQIPKGIKEKWMPWWNELLDDYCLFVEYDEDDDMPSLDITVIDVPYTKTDDYNRAYNGILAVGEFATTMQKIVAIMKAHQVCNGYIYLPDKTIHRYHRNKKLDYLDTYTNQGNCVIVYKYKADYEDLVEKYGNRATSDILKFQQRKYKILLLQCSECKSFNLQDNCDTILFYTMDYSFIKYKQMIHRLWRLGQSKNTRVIILQHSGTVEQPIWAAVQIKQNMHDLYMSIKRVV